MFVDARPDGSKVILMDDFITFQVKSPISCARILGNHFLLGVYKAAICHPLVPPCFDDPDFGVANGFDARQGVVVACADGDDEFIHQRKQGTYGSFERKPQIDAIADKSKATDGRCGGIHVG